MMRLVMEATMAIAIVSILVFLTKISANQQPPDNTADNQGEGETPEHDQENP